MTLKCNTHCLTTLWTLWIFGYLYYACYNQNYSIIEHQLFDFYFFVYKLSSNITIYLSSQLSYNIKNVIRIFSWHPIYMKILFVFTHGSEQNHYCIIKKQYCIFKIQSRTNNPFQFNWRMDNFWNYNYYKKKRTKCRRFSVKKIFDYITVKKSKSSKVKEASLWNLYENNVHMLPVDPVLCYELIQTIVPSFWWMYSPNSLISLFPSFPQFRGHPFHENDPHNNFPHERCRWSSRKSTQSAYLLASPLCALKASKPTV